MTVKEFYKLLEKHDWFYFMSDDHSVYKKGAKEAEELFALAKNNDYFRKLYDGYCEWADSFINGGKVEKPKEPK
jgi:tyrosine-protein phosphatase YwqE